MRRGCECVCTCVCVRVSFVWAASAKKGRGLKILHTHTHRDLEQAIDITSISNSHAKHHPTVLVKARSLLPLSGLSLTCSRLSLSLSTYSPQAFGFGSFRAFVRWRQFWRLPAGWNTHTHTQISSNLIASNQQPTTPLPVVVVVILKPVAGATTTTTTKTTAGYNRQLANHRTSVDP